MNRSEALELANEALDDLWRRTSGGFRQELSDAMTLIREMIVEEATAARQSLAQLSKPEGLAAKEKTA